MATPVSPKVHAAGASAPVVIVLMWLLDKIPVVASMPGYVHIAALAIVTGVVVWLAGFQIPDKLRDLGAKFDNNPATAPKNEAGQVTIDLIQFAILITLLLIFLFGTGVVR